MRQFLKRRAVPLALAMIASSLAILTYADRESASLIPVTQSAPLTTMSNADDATSGDATNAVQVDRVRGLDIDFFTARIQSDATGSADRASLASLLFARSKATGSSDDLALAEAFARDAIRFRATRNGTAFELLASILMTRHAFADAREIMEQANTLEPETPSHLALLGEIELELGEYEAAARHFRAVHFDGQQFTIGARVARWYELTGHADIARTLLERSAMRADRRDDLPRDQVAWFHYRAGDLALRVGHLTDADVSFQRALAINPNDARALGGLARLALLRHEWQNAIRFGERATAELLDPATVAVMSIAYAALGDQAQAASYAQALSVSAGRASGGMHRAYGLFLLDHGPVLDRARDRARVFERARADIRQRHDVYGYDLLAWAAFRSGRIADAKSAMTQALAQHTEDVTLAEHARAIFSSDSASLRGAARQSSSLANAKGQ